MKQNGQHIILDAFGCKSKILDDADKLEKLLLRAIDALGMEVISSHFHRFEPHGVTGTIVISTSHFSIHTWPENGYAAMDLYTCGNQELRSEVDVLLKELGSENVNLYELKRGSEIGEFPEMNHICLPTADLVDSDSNSPKEALKQFRKNKGNTWDQIQLKQILTGKFQKIHQSKSDFQDILLMEANDIRLYLDQELQFSSLDERCYHEALIHPAMALAGSRENVLILGGGDGLGLREVLAYPEVKKVDLVDIDPVMIKFASTIPEMISLNQGAFQDQRVTVHIDDAKRYLAKNKNAYDVIIIDFPDPVNSLLAELYTTEVFKDISRSLRRGGMIVCQSNSPEDAPEVFWSIGETFKSAGLKTEPYQVIVPSFGFWGFHLASPEKIDRSNLLITAAHNTLPEDLQHLFTFTEEVLKKQQDALSNSMKSLTLHELYKKSLSNYERAN
ncbi:adenosylmethionine decarboxylase [Pseudalkalibacillus sp. R45]|uniref:adenosylmethionine decarboxylase n=1 Tax=Pseudalkalibacillus sp. R45 TaxID=3457433 RepID=UPI003FCE0E12